MKRIIYVLFVLLITTGFVFANGNGEEAADDSGGSEQMAASEAMEGFKVKSAAGVTVQWMVDGDMLQVQVSAKTTGWVAVGFDPSRQMADANIIIGYVSNGTAQVEDHYGIGNVRHGADTQNGGTANLSNVSGSESGGVTTLSFTIPLDSGDDLDKALVPGTTYKFIAAHGPDGADDFGTYHGSRGSFEAEL